jgi:hypothetical protein
MGGTLAQHLGGFVSVDFDATSAPDLIFDVTFFTLPGDLADFTVVDVSAGGATLSAADVVVTTSQDGGGQPMVHKFVLDASSSSLAAETFTLQVGGQSSTAIAGNAVDVDVEAAVDALLGSGAAVISRSATVGEVRELYVLVSGEMAMPPASIKIREATSGIAFTEEIVQHFDLSHMKWGAVDGRSYRCRVRAKNVHGWSAYSPMVSVIAGSVPPAPAAPEYSDITAQSISLTWDAPASNGGSPVTGYKVYMFPSVARNTLTNPHPVANEVQSVIVTSSAPTNEVQVIEIIGAASGTFAVHFTDEYGNTMNTAALAINDASTPATLQAELRAECADFPVLCDATVSANSMTAPDLNVTITFDSSFGDVPLVVVNDLNMAPVGTFNATVTEQIKGGSHLGGDYTLTYAGHQTGHIPVTATAADVERALEALPSIGSVDVVRHVNTGSVRWDVTFVTDLGNLPRIEVTTGRLTGKDAHAEVLDVVSGTPTVLVYDGTDAPNIHDTTVTGIETGNTYAFRVVALNAVGDGTPSTASVTVVARAGASPGHTTARGSALVQGYAGLVFEQVSIHVNPDSESLASLAFTVQIGTLGTPSTLIDAVADPEVV